MRTSARIAAFAAALALAGCDDASPRGSDRVESRAWTVGLAPGSALAFLSGLELRGSSPGFGGFSALEVSADGERLVALSDQGSWLEARLVRRDGRLVGLAEVRWTPMQGDDDERPVSARRDAEGLAIADPMLAGPRFVSFERAHRISRFESAEAAERPAPGPVEIGALGPNEGLEALAFAPDGRLLAVRETTDPMDAPFSAWWIGPDGVRAPTEIRRLGAGDAVGADVTPDGRLLLLVRRFSVLGGFRYAVWRFRIAGDALTEGEILHVEPPGEGADNAEGIAAWRDPAGRTRVLLMTDDNFSLMQRTLLIEAALSD